MDVHTQKRIDDIFLVMGDLKIFSITQLILMTLHALPAPFQLLSNLFICRPTTHHCASGDPNATTHLLSDMEKEYNYQNLTITHGKCDILVSLNDTVLKKEKCIYGMEYDLVNDFSVISQFDLVCEHSYLVKLSQSLVIAGQGVGALVFTMFSDRFGRKMVYVASNVGLLLSGLTIAYAPSHLVFAIGKFVVGAFQQGSIAVSHSMKLEILTTKNRRLEYIVSGLSWGVGCLVLATLAYGLRNFSWRTLQMVLSLSSILFLLQWFYLKESLRWLIANGKKKESVAYIRKATKVNKTSFEHTVQAYEKACCLLKRDSDDIKGHSELNNSASATKKLTLLDLLKVKRLLLNAAIMWLAWFTASLSFFVIYLGSTSLAGNPYLNFSLITLMESFGSFLLYVTLNRYGRRFSMKLSFALLGTGLILSGIFQSFQQTTLNSAMSLLFSCVAMIGASCSFGFAFFYTPEIFPTNMRNQAIGLCSMISRVGGMLAPFSGILGEQIVWGPGALIACLTLFVCLLSNMLPETKGRELPQTIEDVMSWYSERENHQTKESEVGEDFLENDLKTMIERKTIS